MRASVVDQYIQSVVAEMFLHNLDRSDYTRWLRDLETELGDLPFELLIKLCSAGEEVRAAAKIRLSGREDNLTTRVRPRPRLAPVTR